MKKTALPSTLGERLKTGAQMRNLWHLGEVFHRRLSIFLYERIGNG